MFVPEALLISSNICLQITVCIPLGFHRAFVTGAGARYFFGDSLGPHVKRSSLHVSTNTFPLVRSISRKKGVRQNLRLLAMRERLQQELHTSLMRLITKRLPLSEAVEFGVFSLSR